MNKRFKMIVDSALSSLKWDCNDSAAVLEKIKTYKSNPKWNCRKALPKHMKH